MRRDYRLRLGTENNADKAWTINTPCGATVTVEVTMQESTGTYDGDWSR